MRRSISAVLGVASVIAAAPAHAASAPARLGADVKPDATVPSDAAFAVVQVTNLKGFTRNPNLSQQFAAATALGDAPQLYIVGAMPGPTSPNWPRNRCAGVASASCARQYGIALAADALAHADATIPATPVIWWIDVETGPNGPTWFGPGDQNLAAINGMVDELVGRSDRVSAVGIYSTREQWSAIAGTGTVHLVTWSGSAQADEPTAAGNCTAAAAFVDGPVVLTQYARPASAGVSGDVECPPALPAIAPTPTGRSVDIIGTALPHRALTISIRTGGTTTTRTAAASGSGRFTIRFVARYATTITATDSAGSTSRTLAVLPAVSPPTVTATPCHLRATGTVRPFWPGQQVQVRVTGGRGRTVTSKRTASGGRWTLDTAEPCGALLHVAAHVVGTAHGVRYVKDATGATASARS